MKKLNDWWNTPITNGTIVKWYVKSAVYTIISTYAVHICAKKLREMDDETIIYTTETDSEDKEV